ncbi:MAG: LamG domain-containing protein [Candidatus Pacearchaeota archaeon]|nr:LamG domain-containing protein [Candidatus Pacearchaeota archaeon]
MKKRGLSTIVASVLIILLVIIAIGIIWAILKPKLFQSAEEIDSSLLTVSMKIEKASVLDNLATVKISRQPGSGQVDKIRIVLYNETDSQVESVSGLNEFESRTYTITTKISNISKISIAPVSVREDQEKVGTKADEYILRKTTVQENPSGCTRNEECTTSEQCKNAPGTCDTATGTCSFTDKADDSSCTSCGASCWCKSGACVDKPTCPAGLVGYWKMNENSGTLIVDRTGKNNGTISGTVNLIAGKIGNAAQFSGGWIDVGKDSSLNIQGPLTVEAWIKPNSGMTNGNYYYNILGKQTIYELGYGLNIAGAYNSFNFWTRNPSAVSAAGWGYTNEANVINRWIHLVGVFNGNKERFYVNGTLVADNNGGVASGDTSTCPLRIGNTGCPGGGNGYSDQPFSGTIDEVAVWNKALTQAEVLDHYNSGIGKELC